MPRQKAVGTLTEALVRQFGPSARGVIEKEIESRLGGCAKPVREDLDDLERGVLAAVRAQRSSERSRPQSCAVGGGGIGRAARLACSAPALGVSSSSTGGKATSSTTAAEVQPSTPKVPYERLRGLAATDSGFFPARAANASAIPRWRKGQPRPPDHFTAIAAHEVEMRRQEEEAHWARCAQRAADFRKKLDGQVQDRRELRLMDAEAGSKRANEEAAIVIAECQRAEVAEAAKRDAWKEHQRQIAYEASHMLERRRASELVKKKREDERYSCAFDEEKLRLKRLAEEQRQTAVTVGKKDYQEMQAVLAEHAVRRAASKEVAKTKTGSEWPDNGMALRRAIASRQTRVDQIVGSLGQQAVDMHTKRLDDIEARAERHEQEANRKMDERLAREKKERRDKEHALINTWKVQLRERALGDVSLHEQKKYYGANDKQMSLDYEAEEKEKRSKAKKARQDVDAFLFKQMRQNAVVHPLEFGLTPKLHKQELEFHKSRIDKVIAASAADGNMLEYRGLP